MAPITAPFSSTALPAGSASAGGAVVNRGNPKIFDSVPFGDLVPLGTAVNPAVVGPLENAFVGGANPMGGDGFSIYDAGTKCRDSGNEGAPAVKNGRRG